jgi:hypothetical protein
LLDLTKTPEPSEAPATPSISAARRALVDRARKEWIDRLIDPSRNNNLLFFRPLKLATLDLSDPEPEASEALIRGETVPLDCSVIFPDVRSRSRVPVSSSPFVGSLSLLA